SPETSSTRRARSTTSACCRRPGWRGSTTSMTPRSTAPSTCSRVLRVRLTRRRPARRGARADAAADRALGAGLGAPAGAQPRRPGAPAAADRREEIKKRIRAMRAYTLTEELKLDPEIAGQLFPLLARYDDETDKLLEKRVEVQRRLRRAET